MIEGLELDNFKGRFQPKPFYELNHYLTDTAGILRQVFNPFPITDDYLFQKATGKPISICC